MTACLVYYKSFRAINGEKEDAKKKESKQSFLPTLTALFAPQGLGQKKGKKEAIKDNTVVNKMIQKVSLFLYVSEDPTSGTFLIFNP